MNQKLIKKIKIKMSLEVDFNQNQMISFYCSD